MAVGQIGETGVHVSAITALEQELGIKLDLVPTLLLSAMEGSFSYFSLKLFVLNCTM